MGFGGSVAAMITSLKNNKRERKTRFDKDMGQVDRKPFVDHKKSSPEQLAALRERIKQEQALTSLRTNVLIVLILAALAGIALWIMY